MSISPYSLNTMALTRLFYGNDKCGVCDKKEGDTFWYSPKSRIAHASCCAIIKPFEAKLVATINRVFHDACDRNEAHVKAIGEIKEKLGDVAIKTFLENEGVEKLQSLFDAAEMTFAKKEKKTKENQLACLYAQRDALKREWKTKERLMKSLNHQIDQFRAQKKITKGEVIKKLKATFSRLIRSKSTCYEEV